MTSAANVYHSVIADVVSSVRDAFQVTRETPTILYLDLKLCYFIVNTDCALCCQFIDHLGKHESSIGLGFLIPRYQQRQANVIGFCTQLRISEDRL